MRTIHIVLYWILGIATLGAALFALIHPLGKSPEEMHLGRELAAAMVFVALMFLWCARNYEQRRAVHGALIVFAVLLALVHWLDYFHGTRPLMSGVINSVLAAVLLAMTPDPR